MQLFLWMAGKTQWIGCRSQFLIWVNRTPLELLSQVDPADLQKLDDILTALDYGMHA
jgi:hypothetical protein